MLFILIETSLFAQLKDSVLDKQISEIQNIPKILINRIEIKYGSIEKKVSKSDQKILTILQKKEMQLQKRIKKLDGQFSQNLFANSESKYQVIVQKIKNPVKVLEACSFNQYIPKLDSLQTAFHFMEKSALSTSTLSLDKQQQLKEISKQIKGLQAQLQVSEDVAQFIKERKQLLQEQLGRFGLTDQLKKINKQVYYYQQQMLEYKRLLSDPNKATEKAMSYVREMPAFQEFIGKYSMLAQLFPKPTNLGSAKALEGLQTSTQVKDQIVGTINQTGSGVNPQQFLQQQLQEAQAQINLLKDKVNKLGGGNSDLVMPDFKPNQQKPKSFWKRLEYGINVQSQKPNGLLPVTTDMALTMGYKLNDKSILGIGASYKLGWGKDINHISISSEGIGLRTFVDIKLKKSIWITGGYEQNYMQAFEKIPQLNDFSKWQQSGLIGLSKKYKIGTKAGNFQLLWDLLSYTQIPITQPLKFRIGYVF